MAKGVFEKMYGSARTADQIVAAVQAQDFSKAFNGLQSLVGKPDITKEQASVLSRALLTVNNQLQAAQAKGDVKAAETIRVHNAKK